MPGFSYKVIDSDGRERKGNMNAPSVLQVEKRLSQQGLIIVEIEEIELFGNDSMFGRGRITSFDLTNFCSQFVHLSRAGIGTINVLKMMAEQTKNKKLKLVCEYLSEQISEGTTLGEAMSNADVFPKPLVAAVEAGEAKGRLADNMERMAEYYDASRNRRDLTQRAILYPAFIAVVILLVIAGVLVYVVPSFMDMIDGIVTTLPLSTRITLGISELLTKRIWVFIILIAVLFMGLIWLRVSRSGQTFRSRLRTKYKGMFERKALEDCASFASCMTALLYSGIPLATALELTGNSYAEHVIFKRKILKARDYVSSGGALSKYLEGSDLLPKMFVNMIAIGEETGHFKEMFKSADDYYEREFEDSIRKTTAILEPLLVFLLALILGAVVVSLIKPLIALFEAVGSM